MMKEIRLTMITVFAVLFFVVGYQAEAFCISNSTKNDINESNALLNRLESLFPELLSPTPQETIQDHDLLYRCYPATNVCTGTFAGQLLYLDQQEKLHHLGAVDYWIQELESLIGWAVGGQRGETYKPKIFYTDNGGQKWQVQDIPQGLDGAGLNDVSVVDTRNVWAVGGISGQALVLKTNDGGQNWARMPLPSHSSMNKELYGVTAVDKNRVWAVGGDGLIVSTSDGGLTWQKHDSGIPDAIFQAVKNFNNQYFWAVGATDQSADNTAIAKSTDGGQTWQKIESNLPQPAAGMIEVGVYDSETVWVVGHNYYVAKTEDGGQSWTKLHGGAMYDANGVSVVSPDKTWVVMDQGGIYSFSQSGSECEQQDVPGVAHGYHLLKVSAISDQQAWVFGAGWGQDDQGIIMHTTNGGTDWYRQNLPVNAEVTSGGFVNSLN